MALGVPAGQSFPGVEAVGVAAAGGAVVAHGHGDSGRMRREGDWSTEKDAPMRLRRLQLRLPL